MAQPSPISSGVYSSGHERERKISAPKKLWPHIGTPPTSPVNSTHPRNKSFPSPKFDGVHRPPSTASASSSVVNTPISVRRELYRNYSADDLLRNYKAAMKSIGHLEEEETTHDSRFDNRSFISDEHHLKADEIPASQNKPTAFHNKPKPEPISLGNVSSSYNGTVDQNDLQKTIRPQTIDSGSPDSFQGGSIDGDSVFSENATPSTAVAETFFGVSPGQMSLVSDLFTNNDKEMNKSIGYCVSDPTTPKERKRWLIQTLSTNLSIIYILLLVVVGIICYVMDMFSGYHSDIAEGFNIYLMLGQISFLAYIHSSVRNYINNVSQKLRESTEKRAEKKQQGDTKMDLDDLDEDIPQEYGFTDSSHGGSLYLKIGATVFCMGHLIFSGLELSSKIAYYMHDHEDFNSCSSMTDIVMSVMLLIYIFYQLFFAFKFSNLIINKRMILSKFGIMHCIGSSLCYWIYMIIQETLASLLKKSQKKDYGTYDTVTTIAPITLDLTPLHAEPASSDSNSSLGTLYMGCTNSTQISSIITTSAPYLYPFSIEFNILMVGFWILLWENHGKIEKHHRLPSIEVTYEEDDVSIKNLASNLVIYVDCHASNRGLFMGLLLSIAAVISIILYIVFSSDGTTLEQALLINSLSDIVVLSIMIVTTTIAFYYTRSLDIIHHKISAADDILLYICLPSVFMYSFFILVPYSLNGDYLYVSANVLRVIQSILQTALIIDGLRRCSNAQHLKKKKPGREVVIFLVVMNVASWLLMSFQIISVDGNASLYDFYGKEVWTAVSHLTLPLSLFYRFHSSVCLADIWKDAYEPEAHH